MVNFLPDIDIKKTFPGPIKIYIDLHSIARSFDTHRQTEVHTGYSI